jgi:hypothetical protein
MAIRRLGFLHRFSPMCYTSARGREMKALFNNNLLNQTNDVMVNPENPDSNIQLLRA